MPRLNAGTPSTVVAVFAAVGVASLSFAHENTSPPGPVRAFAESAYFARADSAIVIDGRLDELPWTAAPPLTRFFEVYPANLGPPPADTEVRFVYDDKKVYVGVRAYDPQPAAIRAPLSKRDQIESDQDYAEVFIDTASRRRTALAFRTNARGVAADAQFNDDTQARNLAPDFDFEVRTSVDDDGWSAEFAIPLATLRYEAGDDQAWTFLVVRGYPRTDNVRIASAPIPRGANCQLCFAGELRGISPARRPVPLLITPQAAFSRSETEGSEFDSHEQEVRAGVDVRWQPQPNSIVDLTVRPDFSQVEADAVQLTANARFALFLPEKRPFFLEGVDLLSTPISALYTRSIADPDFGARLTHRGDSGDVTILAVRDAGGGTVIEPGASSSQAAAQESESTAFIGRYRATTATTTVGALGSVRSNDDGSHNLVAGADAYWSPSVSDRLVAQFLWSQTENPDRPDLLPAWTGQGLAGAAGLLRWEHRAPGWYADVLQEIYSHDFRTWNGFVAQAGIARLATSAGLNFFPNDSFLVRVSPLAQFSRTDELGGRQIDGSESVGLQLDGALGTSVTLTLQRIREPTTSRLVTLDYLSLSLAMSPLSWLPAIRISATRGDGIDHASETPANDTSLSASLQLRPLDRLTFDASLARQTLDSARDSQLLLQETAVRTRATWHLSERAYLQLLHQHSATSRPSPTAPSPAQERSTSEFSSLLLSLQTTWRTRFFLGFSRDEFATATNGQRDTQTVAFAKFSYAFSVDEPGPLLEPFWRLTRNTDTTSLNRNRP